MRWSLRAGVRLRTGSRLHLLCPPPQPCTSLLYPKTPGSCQPSQGPVRSGAGRRRRQKPQQVYVLAAAALLSSQVPVSHIHPSPLGAGRGPVGAQEARVSPRSCRPHNLGPFLFRGHPESCSWPHLYSFQSSPVSPLPGSPLGTPPPCVGRVCFGFRRGPGGDLDPRPWTPGLQLATPRTPGFSLALPCLSCPLWGWWESSFYPQGLRLRGFTERGL